MNKKYNLKFDLQFRCNNSKMIFDEFDENTSDFFMQITRQGQLVDISNAIPTLLVLKPSGVAVSQILNVKDNLVYGNLNNSLKNEVGTYIAKLMLVEGDKKTFISNISYEVTENALLGMIDDDIVEDERYSVLLQLLERLSNIELQEQTRVDNENSRIEAENLRGESIEKIKNDIDFLVNETNKKVDINLNSNTSKIDNLIIDTKEELNKYKENKDKFINEDLEEFKENTNKSIENYKASKDIEIDNTLNTYKTNTTNDINSFKNTVNSKIDKYKNDKDKAINEYIEGKSLELDNYAETKNNELDLYVSEKDILIDSKISEIDNAKTQMQDSINNKLIEVDNTEQIRQQEHESRQQFLSGFEGKLNTVVDDVAGIKDDVVAVREANKRQDVFLQGLYNENLDGRVTVKEEGSVISLTNSDDGLVDIVGLEGNTLVNYCTDGAKELTLNGDIDVEGTNVTLTEGADNGLVDVVCEGNTFVNLLTNGFATKTWTNSFETTETTLKLKFTENSYPTYGIRTYNLKPNTKYTFIVDVDGVENIISDYWCILRLGEGDGKTNVSFANPTKSGKHVVCATTPNVAEVSDLQIFTRPYADKKDSIITLSNPILLEGDWTNKELPREYFEGMKSVGECEDNKIETVSQNKNLWNPIIDDSRSSHNKTQASLSNGVLTVKGVGDGSKEGYTNPYYLTMKLKPNTDYSFSYLSDGEYGGNGSDSVECFIWDLDTNTNITKKSVSPSGAKFNSGNGNIGFRFDVNLNDKTHTFYNFQLEEGTQPTSYIEPKLNKKEITLSEPLRALPNGVCDKVVKIGGKWYVERNCGQVVLDGSHSMYRGKTGNNIPFASLTIADMITDRVNTQIIINCDNIQCYSSHGFWQIGESKNAISSVLSHASLRIMLSGKMDESTIINDVKAWLSQNPTTVVYELATPYYEELPTDPTLSTYNDITHISNNSTIPCNMKIQNTGYNAIIKPNTKYTVAFDTNTSETVGINLGGSKVTTTNNVATVTTPSTLVDDSLRLTGKGIKASKVRLLEDDKTNWIPSYFEGMKSSFEDKLQDDGTYKMEILSNNKNLFRIKDVITYNMGQSVVINENSITITQQLEGAWNYYGYGLSHLKPNTKYTVSANIEGDANTTRVRIFNWYGSKEVTSFSGNSFRTFTTPNDTSKLAILLYTSYDTSKPIGTVGKFSNIMIEEGDKTSYVPSLLNKIQFSSIEPLRGVGNVKDRFVFKDDGKLMIERNCGEVILDGSEEWSGNYLFPNRGRYSTPFPLGGKLVVCDSFCCSNGNFGEGVIGSDDLTKILLTINRSKGSIHAWLKTNPIKVVYQLSEPTYEEIPLELQKIILEGYENGTLLFDTNIPPTITASYTANIPVVSKLNKVNETTETNTEDIAITQMAVDFLLMSTLGEEMLNFKIRSGYNMASYFASRIIKGALKYEDVINKYPQYKEDINLILISEGYSDLIIEL